MIEGPTTYALDRVVCIPQEKEALEVSNEALPKPNLIGINAGNYLSVTIEQTSHDRISANRESPGFGWGLLLSISGCCIEPIGY